MKHVKAIKNISIVLLVLLAFFQFVVLISSNYSDLSALLNKINQQEEEKTGIFAYDYILIESIRISDGKRNYWDLDTKSSDYLQIKMAVNEIAKHCYTDNLNPVETHVWNGLLMRRNIMIQYFFDMPLSYIHNIGKYSENMSLKKIEKIIILPSENDMDIYIYDGKKAYKLLYDLSENNILNSIDYANIFNYVQYSNFYDDSLYGLFYNNKPDKNVRGRPDVKIYDNDVQKNPLAITIIPDLLYNIKTATGTKNLKEIKDKFLDILKDRYALSLGSENTVYMSNLENQYSLSYTGKISYDYYGKVNYFQKGDIGMAYNEALNMLNRFLNLVNENSYADIALTEIDYLNPNYYTFYFDYVIGSNKLIMISDNQDNRQVEHAFSIRANENNVIKATGLIRNIYVDVEEPDKRLNNTKKILNDNILTLRGKKINNIYNGYILQGWFQKAYINPALLIDCEDKVFGFTLPAARDEKEVE